MEPVILLEQANPYSTRVAQLESDGRTIYMYMSPVDDLPGQTHAVWVQNLVEANEQTDSLSMKEGVAPLLKKSSCKHPEGKAILDKSKLDFVWFAEGSGVSLYVDGSVEAIIPPFAGQNSVHGYARECIEFDCGTVPLPDSESFLSRLQENLDFWTLRSKKDCWQKYRDSLLAHYESTYGKHTQYFALSRSYPPMAIVEFKAPDSFGDDERIYCSLGMSFQPMPGVEVQNADYVSSSRMEMVSVGSTDFKDLVGLLGRIALYPWLSGKSFQNEHRYDSGMEIEKSAYLFTNDFTHTHLKKPSQYTTDDGYIVNFLNSIAVHQETLLVAQSRGIGVALKKINEDS